VKCCILWLIYTTSKILSSFSRHSCVCVCVCVCNACVLFLHWSLFNDAVSILRVIYSPCSCLPHPTFNSNCCTQQFLRPYKLRLRIVAIIRDPQYYKCINSVLCVGKWQIYTHQLFTARNRGTLSLKLLRLKYTVKYLRHETSKCKRLSPYIL
jgi:hypothetical protein